MDYRLMFKGEYVAAIELKDKQPTLTIKEVKPVDMEETDDEEKKGKKKGKTTTKWVIFFKETDRGWVFSKTCAICMATMFGLDSSTWLGKRVTLYFDPEVRFGADKVGGIRLVGSPDIQRPVDVVVKLPKRKAVTKRMQVTVAGRPPAAKGPGNGSHPGNGVGPSPTPPAPAVPAEPESEDELSDLNRLGVGEHETNAGDDLPEQPNEIEF